MRTLKIYLDKEKRAVQIINIRRDVPHIEVLVSEILRQHFPTSGDRNFGYEIMD